MSASNPIPIPIPHPYNPIAIPRRFGVLTRESRCFGSDYESFTNKISLCSHWFQSFLSTCWNPGPDSDSGTTWAEILVPIPRRFRFLTRESRCFGSETREPGISGTQGQNCRQLANILYLPFFQMEGPVNTVSMFLQAGSEGPAKGPGINFGTYQVYTLTQSVVRVSSWKDH